MRFSLHWAPLASQNASAALSGAALALLGWFLGQSLWQGEIEALEQLRGEVRVLQGQVRPGVPDGPVRQALAHPAGQQLEPDSRHAPQVWPWLQQRLQAHGLQVQALRPGVLEGAAALPVQTVVLELQGRWSDWLAFERELGQHAPWWTVAQWQVTPAGVPQQVRMQWHLRWGWRPPALAPTPAPAPDLPDWPVGESTAGGLDLFDAPQSRNALASASATAPAPAPEPSRGSDPARWSVQGLRLQGIWQQAGVAHAVLGQGLHQVVVKPGQRVGSEGYRVWQVGADAVILRAAGARSPDIRLDWTGGSR